MEKIKKLLKEIPGFRSGKIWKGIVAAICVYLPILICLQPFEASEYCATKLDVFLDVYNMAPMALFLILCTVITAVLPKLRFYRTQPKFIKVCLHAAGYSGAFVIFILSILGMDGLYSDQYKTAKLQNTPAAIAEKPEAGQNAEKEAEEIKESPEPEHQTQKEETIQEEPVKTESAENAEEESVSYENESDRPEPVSPQAPPILFEEIPAYSGSGYVVVNNNIPFFEEQDMTVTAYEYYSNLDDMGRCGFAMACIGTELMPTEERESISHVHPTGWQGGEFGQNRCHLIAFCLAGENDTEENLITGMRDFNAGSEGMLPFENLVHDYVKETNHHVILRSTPYFADRELMPRGVLLEAQSVEDDEVCFNVFIYNVQKGCEIDYATGEVKNYESEASSDENSQNDTASIKDTEQGSSDSSDANETDSGNAAGYIANKNSGVFHFAGCSSVKRMKESNKYYSDSRDELVNSGYRPCENCNP